LFGDRSLDTDWRLFTTLVHFDAFYFGHSKCNLRRLVNYPNLWGYARDLFQKSGIAQTVTFDHIRRHGFGNDAEERMLLPSFSDALATFG
jgi:putative glutathione S-transferase